MLKNVSPGLIENVKDLKISLNELTVYDFDVYSSIEVYYKIAHKLNDIIRELSRFEGLVSDEVIKQNNKLLYLLGEGLENEVIKEIDNLKNQNFFDDLVDVTLINKLNDRLDNVDSQLEQKANKGGSISVSQIDKNLGKLDQTYMTDEFLQQIAGNTPINSTPSDWSITRQKLADKSIDNSCLNFDDPVDILNKMEYVPYVRNISNWQSGYLYGVNAKAYSTIIDITSLNLENNYYITFNDELYDISIGMKNSEGTVVKDSSWITSSNVSLNKHIVSTGTTLYITIRNKKYTVLNINDVYIANVNIGVLVENKFNNLVSEVEEIKKSIDVDSINTLMLDFDLLKKQSYEVINEAVADEYVADTNNWQKGTSYETHSKAFSVKLNPSDIDITKELKVVFNYEEYDLAVALRDDNGVLVDKGWKKVSPYTIEEEYINNFPNATSFWLTFRNKDYGILTSEDLSKANVNLCYVIEKEFAGLKDEVENISTRIDNLLSTPQQYIRPNTVKMVGHAGLDNFAPENTIPSFACASRFGFEFVECDLRTTSDGHFVLMHDNTVDRTTDGTGNVADMTLEDIKSLNIDYGSNIENYPNLKVPTLEELLKFCKMHKLKPVLEVRELTDVTAQTFIDVVRQYGFEYDCIVISFYKASLEKIRKLSKNIILQPLLDLTVENIDYCYNTLGLNAGIDTGYTYVTKELVDYAHSKGVLVNCWTVNDYNIINQLIENGVDYITTNRSIYTNDINNSNNIITKVPNGTTNYTSTIEDLELNNDILDVELELFINSGSVNLTIGAETITLNSTGDWQYIKTKTVARGNTVKLIGNDFRYNNFKITIQKYK